MSKWRFESMPESEARRILAAGDFSLDTLPDRIKARRLLERRYANDGRAAPPITTLYVRCHRCEGTRHYNRWPCSLCSARGWLEEERSTKGAES